MTMKSRPLEARKVGAQPVFEAFDWAGKARRLGRIFLQRDGIKLR
jgi:hypothetical protein